MSAGDLSNLRGVLDRLVRDLAWTSPRRVASGSPPWMRAAGVTVNSMESVWAVFKRGVLGVYHYVSPKHVGRYAHEFAFRLNDGNVERHTMERLGSLIGAAEGQRLTYAELTS